MVTLAEYLGSEYGSASALRIEPPESEEQIVRAYLLYLQSLPAEARDFDATEGNARYMVESMLGPAWKRGEPILFAVMGETIVGATFTTLVPKQLTTPRPAAWGHGTWVREDMRGQGVARALMEAVRGRLRAVGVVRQIGQAHIDNHKSLASFQAMGFSPCGAILENKHI